MRNEPLSDSRLAEIRTVVTKAAGWMTTPNSGVHRIESELLAEVDRLRSAAPAPSPDPEADDERRHAVVEAAEAWAEVRRTRRGGAISRPIENENDVREIALGFAAEQRALDDLLAALGEDIDGQ